MNIEFIYNDERDRTLVAVREIFSTGTCNTKKIIFGTISPNPKVNVPITRRWNNRKVNGKIRYGKLPQKNQFDYCIRMLRSSYNYSENTQIYGGWELNQSGNVHLHFLFYDPNIQNDTMLQILRRDVLNSELVFKNLSKNMTDYCNNIVFVNDSLEERLKYIHKSNTLGLPFPFFYSNIQIPKEECIGGVSEEPWVPHDSVSVSEQKVTMMRESETEQCHPSLLEAVYLKDIDRILYDDNVYIRKRSFYDSDSDSD